MPHGVSINVSIIAAIDQLGGIGFGGGLPWGRLKADMVNFRDRTWGKAVIMGRRTFESLPDGPLEGRFNIVVSRHIRPGWHHTVRSPRVTAVLKESEYPSKLSVTGVEFFVAPSVRDAILAAMRHGPDVDEIMVIGGGEIYRDAIPFATKMYITRVPGRYHSDTSFPILLEHSVEWQVRMVDEFSNQQGLVFETWERKEEA